MYTKTAALIATLSLLGTTPTTAAANVRGSDKQAINNEDKNHTPRQLLDYRETADYLFENIRTILKKLELNRWEANVMTLRMDTLVMATISCGAIATKGFPATFGELPTLRVTPWAMVKSLLLRTAKPISSRRTLTRKTTFGSFTMLPEYMRSPESKAMNAVLKAFH